MHFAPKKERNRYRWRYIEIKHFWSSKLYKNGKTWILSEGDYFYGWPKTDHVWSRVCRKYIFARKAGQKCKSTFPFLLHEMINTMVAMMVNDGVDMEKWYQMEDKFGKGDFSFLFFRLFNKLISISFYWVHGCDGDDDMMMIVVVIQN